MSFADTPQIQAAWWDGHRATSDPKLRELLEKSTVFCRENGFDAAPPIPLRYVPGRRLTALVSSAGGTTAVLKMFSSPRARGNARRLQNLSSSLVSTFIPSHLGVDESGHIELLSFAEGTVLDRVDDTVFVSSLWTVGRQLRALHEAPVLLDRTWTLEDEETQLLRSSSQATIAAASVVLSQAKRSGVAFDPVVCAHRDFHPRQIVISATPEIAKVSAHFIDMDDIAMAPPGLDVGNMIAHLRREEILGARSIPVIDRATANFVAGYGGRGSLAPYVDVWERLSLVRLAGLAEVRHNDADQCARILALLADKSVPNRAPNPASDPADNPASDAALARHADRPVRIEHRGGRSVAVKRYMSGNGGEVFRDMSALWDSPFGRPGRMPYMPEPISFDWASGDLAMEKLDGPALGERGSYGNSLHRPREVAEMLAALHGSGAVVGRRRGDSQVARSVVRKTVELAALSRAVDERTAWRTVCDKLCLIGAILSQASQESEPEQLAGGSSDLVVSHGDFSPRNVIETANGLRLIDFDRMQCAHPARDVAYWCAWLWATQAQRHEGTSWTIAEPFVRAYETASSRTIVARASRFHFHLSAALVRIAHGWSVLRNDVALTGVIVDEALALAQGKSAFAGDQQVS